MDIISKIKTIIKRKKETIIFDIYIKDYDHCNFYFALVFNKNIEKFKVLFVPIDVIDSVENVYEFFCYQFMYIDHANYIINTLASCENKYKDIERNRKVKTLDSYYIEINTYVKNKNYNFIFSQFIDKEFMFFFDIVSLLFDYLPSTVYDLSSKLLQGFDLYRYAIKYNYSFDFDLKKDTLDKIFDKDIIKNCKYNLDDIKYLENVGSRYFAIINNKIIMIEYVEERKIINISSSYDEYSFEHYIVFEGIIEKVNRDFIKLMVVDDERDFDLDGDFKKYYLCYGIDNYKFMVVNSGNDLDINLIDKKRVKIISKDNEFNNIIYNYLDNKYVPKKRDELYNFVFMS